MLIADAGPPRVAPSLVGPGFRSFRSRFRATLILMGNSMEVPLASAVEAVAPETMAMDRDPGASDDGGAAVAATSMSSTSTSPSSASNDEAVATPPPRRSYNATGHPLVTAEKSVGTLSSESAHTTFSIACPDGSIVRLSPHGDGNDDVGDASSQIVIGRGRHGIPTSVTHVSRQACVLRLAKQGEGDRCSLELAVLGSQKCRVTRSGVDNDTVFLKSISSIISSANADMAPSILALRDGDTIEPYNRPVDCTVEEAKASGAYYPFRASITSTPAEATDEPIDGKAFAEASKRMDDAAKLESALDQGLDAHEVEDSAMQTEANKSDGVPNQGGETQDFAALSGKGSSTARKEPKELRDSMQTFDKGSASEPTGQREGEPSSHVASEERDKPLPMELQSSDGGPDQADVNVSAPPAPTCQSGVQPSCDAAKAEMDSSAKGANNNVANEEAEGSGKVVEQAWVDSEMKDAVNMDENEEGTRQAKERPKMDDVADSCTGESTKPNEAVEHSSEDSEKLDESTKYNDQATKPDEVTESKEDAPTSSSDESSEEEYDFDDPRQEVIEVLQEIESPGTFATGGSCGDKLTMPGLEVDGVGTIGSPLSPILAKELIKRCEQAPFGRGSKTMVDKTIRNTFQLAPDHFQTTNPSWKLELEGLTKDVCENLGVERHLKVEARLYKLLVYEEGSFFKPHRDSEKEEGMFGTLVLVLPSKFSGGQLVVKHKGDTEMFEQGKSSKFQSQYIAFYADCKHELTEVTAGYRLCLVYNLVKVGFGSPPQAVDNRSTMKRLIAAARLWGESYCGNKLVLMTEHLYTRAGIKNGKGSSKYKGSDAAVVKLLEVAIENGADLDFSHGKVSFSESGNAEGDGYGHRGYGYYDDSDDDQSYTWAETTDSHLSLELAEHGKIDITEEEMIPKSFFEEKEPDKETFEPTGNEGVSAERQYADSEAIVVWPRSRRWKIVTGDNVSRMCDYLVNACREGTDDSEPREECIRKAKLIYPRLAYDADVKKMMDCIVIIADEVLAKDFLTSHLAANPNKTSGAFLDGLKGFIDAFGAEIAKSLSPFNLSRFSADPSATANFLIKLCDILGQNQTHQESRSRLIKDFVEAASPTVEASRCVPSKGVDSFPLNEILGVLSTHHDKKALSKRVIEGYVWLSCQQHPEPVRHIWRSYSYSRRTASPKGPKLLLSITSFLASSVGEYEKVLIGAAERLCQHGNIDDAIELANKVAVASGSSEDASRICDRMGSIACERALSNTQNSSTLETCKKLVRIIGKRCPSFVPRFTEFAKKLDVRLILYPLVTDSPLRVAAEESMKESLSSLTICCASEKSLTLDQLKNLVRIISAHCPTVAPQFTESVKRLDTDSIVYPLVTDNALRAGAHPLMTKSLSALAYHCAEVLDSSISYLSNQVRGYVNTWSIPHSDRSKEYSDFLRSPCKRTFDWQVRKSDHKGFIRDLGALIRKGEVKTESYQPGGGGGAYHFKIIKLKPQSVSISRLGSPQCSCSRSSSYAYRLSHRTTPSGSCVLKDSKDKYAKYYDAKKKMNAVKAHLTPEDRNKFNGGNISANSSVPSSADPNPGARDLTVTVTKPTKNSMLDIVTSGHPIRITHIFPNSLFAGTALRVGMTLKTINGKTYSSMTEGLALMKEAEGQLSVVACIATPAAAAAPSTATAAATGNPYAAPSARNPSAVHPAVVNPYARGSTGTSSMAQGQISSQTAGTKRKASDVVELLDDDDNVLFEGVVTAEDVITKRRKEAEEGGEIIEID
ncbi:hypothetical protein ACHAWF_011759 [Thalassiosira exigua]